MMTSRFSDLCLNGTLVLGLAVICVGSAQAVVAPSTFTTAIQVQGEAEGTEFDDWASSGIPIATTDPADNGSLIDINTVQIANDNDFIYLRVTYHNNNSVGTFLGFDTDQNLATGFDIFSAGLIGSELAYQNDFPFEQAAGVFNTGDSLTGGPLFNGGALIFPFFGTNGPEKEYAIPLDVAFTNPAQDVFTSDTFDLLVYTDQGSGDVTEVITYTLASAPVVEGDYNGNGVVDAADYTLWLNSLGAIGMDLAADGTSDDLSGVPDGDVDSFDYEYWKANFNALATGSGSAIPEPSTAILLVAAFAGLGLIRR